MSSTCTSCRVYSYGGQVYDTSRRGCSPPCPPPCSGGCSPPCSGGCPPPPCPEANALYDLPVQVCSTTGGTAFTGRIQYTIKPVSLSGKRNYASVSIRYNWTGTITSATTTIYQELFGSSPGSGFPYTQIIPDSSYLVPFIPTTGGVSSITLPISCGSSTTASYIPYALLSGSSVGLDIASLTTGSGAFVSNSVAAASVGLLMVAGTSTTTPSYRLIVLTTLPPLTGATTNVYSFETVLNGSYVMLNC